MLVKVTLKLDRSLFATPEVEVDVRDERVETSTEAEASAIQ